MLSRRSFVPRLEMLEDRCVPSSFSGGSATQFGSILNVSVSNPANAVFLLENGSGGVAVLANGSLNVFNGINNIQVNATGITNAVCLLAAGPLKSPEQVTLNLIGLLNVVFEHVPPGGAAPTLQENPPVLTFQF
jgi:hypothetical protein